MEKEDSNYTEEKEDLEYYAIKCKLKSALRFQDMDPIINSRVDAVNKIWTEAYFLFNLYIIQTLNDNKNIYIDPSIRWSDWKNGYKGQSLLAEYSTLETTNITWSKIYGHGYYDVIDETPVILDNKNIKARRIT